MTPLGVIFCYHNCREGVAPSLEWVEATTLFGTLTGWHINSAEAEQPGTRQFDVPFQPLINQTNTRLSAPGTCQTLCRERGFQRGVKQASQAVRVSSVPRPTFLGACYNATKIPSKEHGAERRFIYHTLPRTRESQLLGNSHHTNLFPGLALNRMGSDFGFPVPRFSHLL